MRFENLKEREDSQPGRVFQFSRGEVKEGKAHRGERECKLGKGGFGKSKREKKWEGSASISEAQE